MKVLLSSLTLLLLLVYILCCISGFNNVNYLGNLNNAFVENFNSNDKENCDTNLDDLNVIIPPNVPVEQKVNYKTGYNPDNFNKPRNLLADNSGKFCFPIVRFKFDGIWTDVDINSTDNQQQEWLLPKKHTKFVDSQYCADKFLHLPQRKMNPGDVIIQPSNNCSIKKNNPIYCRKPTCLDYTGVIRL